MIHYEKVAFYVFKDVERLVAAVDRAFFAKVQKSRTSSDPALTACEELMKLTSAKRALYRLQNAVSAIYNGSTPDEKKLIAYKYFGIQNDVDYKSRTYFRRQNRLANVLKEKLTRLGITEEWFEENLMPLTIVRETARRVAARERQRAELAEKKRAEVVPAAALA